MGVVVYIDEYRKRRQKRLDERGVRMDYEVGNFPGDEAGDKVGKHGGASTRLPYGLCKAAGIDTTGMTPSEAWAALAGETGIKPKDAYKELEKKGSAKDLAKEAKEKAKEVPEKEKLTGSEYLVNAPKTKDAADRFKAAIDMSTDRETVEKARERPGSTLRLVCILLTRRATRKVMATLGFLTGCAKLLV